MRVSPKSENPPTIREFSGDPAAKEIVDLFVSESRRLAQDGPKFNSAKWHKQWLDQLKSPSHLTTLTMSTGGLAHELATIQHTPWDTEILGRPTARISTCVGLS